MLRRHQNLAFAGSIHFVTTVAALRGDWFVESETCEEILNIFEGYRRKFELRCLGYVLMPDHLHALLHQPIAGPLVQNFMQAFKRLTSQKCRPYQYPNRSLWRRRYDDVPIPGSSAARKRIEYMHNNPIRRELVARAENYAWSSARDYFGLNTGIVELWKT